MTPPVDAISGFLLIDKPAGITSAGVVGRVKRAVPRGTKVGHAGTLDAFATGLLLILVGRATRSCEEVMGRAKEYLGTIRLGATTPSDDPETEPTPYENPIEFATIPPTPEQIRAAIAPLVGNVLQVPPRYSALKLGGRRASDRVRAGESIDLPARPVRIDSIDVIDYEWPTISIRVRCGRGTYVRAIARDLGVALNTGGFLASLRRTRIGEFSVDAALTLDRVEPTTVAGAIIPLGPSS